jgi:lipoprotein-anchoring transpeptidase ErfK/SrfK
MPPCTSVIARHIPRRMAAGAVIPLAGGLLLGAVGVAAAAVSSAAPATPAAPASSAAPGLAVPAGSTLVATLHGTTRKYASAGGRATGWIPAAYFGIRSVLPVIATDPGWLRVRLAQRPDGSTAWIKSSAVTLNTTPYRIVINVDNMHLTLYKSGRKVFSSAAGIGTSSDPTPLGDFFVAFIEAPPRPNPGYGPFIMVTSAHSNAIGNWEASGDAVIGIHGPLGDDRLIGTRGAHISHGCIRLHRSAQNRLRDIPAGTPINIER